MSGSLYNKYCIESYDTIGLRYDTTGLKKVWGVFNIYCKIVHEVGLDRRTVSQMSFRVLTSD